MYYFCSFLPLHCSVKLRRRKTTSSVFFKEFSLSISYEKTSHQKESYRRNNCTNNLLLNFNSNEKNYWSHLLDDMCCYRSHEIQVPGCVPSEQF